MFRNTDEEREASTPRGKTVNEQYKEHADIKEYFESQGDQDDGNLQHINDKVFDYLYDRVKDRQISFYAFLNKEFNILNYKATVC